MDVDGEKKSNSKSKSDSDSEYGEVVIESKADLMRAYETLK